MSLNVTWLPTHLHVWAAIYNEHGTQLVLFGIHTCMEGCEFHAHSYILTEWGFKGADAPLIRSIDDNGKRSYWIASIKEEAES